MGMYDRFYVIKNNRVKLLAVVSVGIVVAVTFLFISPAVTSAFASPLTAMSNQPIQNSNGIVILEGVTVIDGTGNLPKPDSTIVINGSMIAYLSSDIANNYNLNFSAAKNVINLTGKYIIPGLFDMHAHVATVLKNSYIIANFKGLSVQPNSASADLV